MKIQIQHVTICLSPETDDERSICATIMQTRGHDVFSLRTSGSEKHLCLDDLGARESVCPVPLNITRSVEATYAPISNLAATPFVLDDERYGSVEGFWQSLKFTDSIDRVRVGALAGGEAKKAGDSAPPTGITFEHGGRTIVRGTWNHWELMRVACEAKFAQDRRARKALLATGNRPLTHRVPKDSRTIPGVIMADIWMKLRAHLQSGLPDGHDARTVTQTP